MLTRRGLAGFSLAAAALPGAAQAQDRFDPDASVPISAADVAWFRTCRATWVDSESGAPGIVPPEAGPDDHPAAMPEPSRSAVARRMERVLCAAFLYAPFHPGPYRLDPQVLPADLARPGQPNEGTVDVTADHITLLRASSWIGSVMDGKRPYGSMTYFVADMATALGHEPAKDASGRYAMPDAEAARLEALHQAMLFVVQAYVQHCELVPGSYTLPVDGWDRPFGPRCATMPAGQVAAYRLWAATRTPDTGPRSLQQITARVTDGIRAKAALLAAG